MLSTFSYSVFTRSFLPIKGLPRPATLRPFPRILESHAKSPKNRLSILCFRHDHYSPETPQPEFIEHYLHEELVQSEFNDSSVTKRDWKSAVQKAANEVVKVIGDRWVVPWTAMTILQVMLLWTTAFWFIGSWMIPFAAHITGFSKESLTFRGQALFSLVTDVTEGLAGVAILLRCLSRFRPLPPDWFKFSLKGNWQLDVIMDVSCFRLSIVSHSSTWTYYPCCPLRLSPFQVSNNQ
ncbi:hypothetical protein E2542_SST17776 [Spatholobus suberectus]|nr:hypothetical protein E2542_SST17776 [Spatholobus suberectus]